MWHLIDIWFSTWPGVLSKGATKEKRDTKLIELKGSLQLDFYLSSFGLCNATCEMHMACLVTLSLKTKNNQTIYRCLSLRHFSDLFWCIILVNYDNLLALNAKAAEELRAKEAEEDEQEVQ